MKSRLIVAAIGVPLLYLIVLSGFAEHLALALLLVVVGGIASLEMCVMLRPLGPWVPAAFAPVALAPLLAWRIGEVGIFVAIGAAIPLLMAFQGMSVRRERPLEAIVATLVPVMYIAPAMGLGVVIRQSEAGFGLIVLLISAVFLNDTAAYSFGRAFGRHKLAPSISPNKSIEGFVAGVIVGSFVMWYGHFILKYDGANVLGGGEALAIGVAVALVVPLGDLFESLLKRSAQVKDPGSMLGDHGGILDRIDAMLLAVPVMYVGCFFVGAL